MSITYPMEFPTSMRLSDCVFTPSYGYSVNSTRGGKFQVASLMPTIWKAELKTAVLTEVEYDLYTAWMDAQKDGLGTFKLYDPSRIRPRAYLSGFPAMVRAGTSTAFDGTCSIVSVSALNNFEITLGGLPVNFALNVRDTFAFTYASATKRALHRIVYGSNGVANSSGQITLTVEPSIVPGWTTSDVVELEKPWACMQIKYDTVDRGKKSKTLHPQVIKFDAYQSLEL